MKNRLLILAAIAYLIIMVHSEPALHIKSPEKFKQWWDENPSGKTAFS